MKVSVITTTYNSAATVRDTLDSVLRQDYPDIEHIIVDGGSTDGTLDIIREYEPRYGGRLRYISEPDHGIYDAMNKGIRLATGDVIGILNSDDWYTADDIVSVLAAPIAAGDAEATYGDVHYVDAARGNRFVRYYSSQRFRRRHMLFGMMPAHPTFYARHTVYERHGLFDTDFRIAADFEHLLRVIYVGRTVTRYVARDCVTMRTGGASTAGISSHLQIMRDHVRAYHKNHVRSNRFVDALRYPGKIIALISGRRR